MLPNGVAGERGRVTGVGLREKRRFPLCKKTGRVVEVGVKRKLVKARGVVLLDFGETRQGLRQIWKS